MISRCCISTSTNTCWIVWRKIWSVSVCILMISWKASGAKKPSWEKNSINRGRARKINYSPSIDLTIWWRTSTTSRRSVRSASCLYRRVSVTKRMHSRNAWTESDVRVKLLKQQPMRIKTLMKYNSEKTSWSRRCGVSFSRKKWSVRWKSPSKLKTPSKRSVQLLDTVMCRK